MIHHKRLTQLARKWQRANAAIRDDGAWCTTSPVEDKGHCAMYMADGKRFEVPLVYLSTIVFSKLLKMSEEEFGFTGDGWITLPCDAAVVEYVMCLLRRNISGSGEGAPELCSYALQAFKLYNTTCGPASEIDSL